MSNIALWPVLRVGRRLPWPSCVQRPQTTVSSKVAFASSLLMGDAMHAPAVCNSDEDSVTRQRTFIRGEIN